MWHDNETSVDYLNFRIVAKACAQLIRNAGDEPVSIGISGGWGVGKSYLVRMIESEFEAERAKYVLVTFTQAPVGVISTIYHWSSKKWTSSRHSRSACPLCPD